MKPIFLPALLLLTLFWGASAIAQEEPSAQLVRKTNLVETQKKDEPAWKEARIPSLLGSGDSLRTGKNAFAQLNYNDGSVVRIASLSFISIDPPQREVRLNLGKILLKFMKGAQKARVVTPGAVAGTLGTVWVEEVDGEGKSTIHVTEGAVAFTSGGVTQKVQAGEFSSAPLNQPPSPPQPFNIAEYTASEPLFEGLEFLTPQEAPANPAQELEQKSPPIEPVVLPSGGGGPARQQVPPPWFP